MNWLPNSLFPKPSPIVFRFDLDKTYLETRFESLRGLAKIPFEGPADKRTVPGVVPLVLGLKATVKRRKLDHRLYFLSASPPQIGDAIRGKLALDGIEYDGIVFKDQLRNLMRGKFRNLREQVGYKLTALLETHSELPPHAEQLLFGDDWESDPLIYSLYADICAGSLRGEGLAEILRRLGVDTELTDRALSLADTIEARPTVRQIFINLARRTPPAALEVFGPRLVPTFNYAQTAACLFALGLLDSEEVAAVARDLIANAGESREGISSSLTDIERRGHLDRRMRARLADDLARREVAAGTYAPAVAALWLRWRGRRRRQASIRQWRLDYDEILRLEREHA